MTTTTEPRWQHAFPNYPANGMPAIPSTWSDGSWRNDACPRFFAAGDIYGEALSVWIDHPDAAERENGPDMPRFIAHWDDARATAGRVVYEGDDFAALLDVVEVERLAWSFNVGLMRTLEPAEWSEMRAVNVDAEPGVCASHDYLDANEVMAAAFEEAMGRPIAFCDDTPEGDAAAEADCILWNAAWSLAHRHYLTATGPNGEYGDHDEFAAWRLTGADHASLTAAGVSDLEPDVAGRAYGPGYIERLPQGWHVVTGNVSEVFDHLADAERMLWALFSASEWENSNRGAE